ncbi:MAG: hypothetical protein AAFN09_06500 [Pseudomonadota bacterium]
MTKIKAALLSACLTLPLAALPGQATAQDENDALRDGLELFGEGARRLLEGLGQEMEPMLDELRPFFEEDMLPFLQGLADQIDDLAVYEMPERLPNGDIIIRRRPDAPPWGSVEIGEGGDVEL